MRPKAGSTIKGTVLIQVAAVDDRDPPGPLRVAVVVGGTQLLPAVYDPVSQLYRTLWNTTRVADAGYVLRAYAVDTQGNRGESRFVQVKVDNVPEGGVPNFELKPGGVMPRQFGRRDGSGLVPIGREIQCEAATSPAGTALCAQS